MKTYIAVFFSGVLFAVGLGISGMTLPQKVIGFLDFFGNWDPSLGLVMIGSVGVYLVLHRLILKRSQPLFASKFHVPAPTSHVNSPLIVGGVLFGVGWGIVGLCPGPALTSLVSGDTQVWIFFVAMIVGMYAEGTLDVANRILDVGGQSVDG